MRSFRDYYQAVLSSLTFSGGTDDLRIINEAYFDSIGNLLDSATLHLQQIMPSFMYEQEWLDMYQVIFDATQDIAMELATLRYIVASQVRERGHIQDDVTMDEITG